MEYVANEAFYRADTIARIEKYEATIAARPSPTHILRYLRLEQMIHAVSWPEGKPVVSTPQEYTVGEMIDFVGSKRIADRGLLVGMSTDELPLYLGLGEGTGQKSSVLFLSEDTDAVAGSLAAIIQASKYIRVQGESSYRSLPYMIVHHGPSSILHEFASDPWCHSIGATADMQPVIDDILHRKDVVKQHLGGLPLLVVMHGLEYTSDDEITYLHALVQQASAADSPVRIIASMDRRACIQGSEDNHMILAKAFGHPIVGAMNLRTLAVPSGEIDMEDRAYYHELHMEREAWRDIMGQPFLDEFNRRNIYMRPSNPNPYGEQPFIIRHNGRWLYGVTPAVSTE